MSRNAEIISSWEKDPNQGFTIEELEVLKNAGLVKEQVHNIL